ncbi:MAG: CBS domain-containing protein [Holophagales bacterium]|nr:CBS domain-containing protein [Holophagales bacterium]
MNVKIADLMSERVILARPHHSVHHVRNLMTRNRLGCVPVVDTDGEAVGIVSAIDLMEPKSGTPVSKVMTEDVLSIPRYNDVHHAARMMRNHRIHHLVVTHEKEVVGVISSFDLLRLVEEHRFVMKAGPTPGRKSTKRQ